MAGSDDRSIPELIAELRDRVIMGGGQDDIYGDELERLVAAIPVWHPIDEAPIPDSELVPTYWTYSCLIQTTTGNVVAGFARYVEQTSRGRAPRILRWYEGTTGRNNVVANPEYFMPLPQPRKD
jgi:hypothetical protein